MNAWIPSTQRVRTMEFVLISLVIIIALAPTASSAKTVKTYPPHQRKIPTKKVGDIYISFSPSLSLNKQSNERYLFILKSKRLTQLTRWFYAHNRRVLIRCV